MLLRLLLSLFLSLTLSENLALHAQLFEIIIIFFGNVIIFHVMNRRIVLHPIIKVNIIVQAKALISKQAIVVSTHNIIIESSTHVISKWIILQRRLIILNNFFLHWLIDLLYIFWLHDLLFRLRKLTSDSFHILLQLLSRLVRSLSLELFRLFCKTNPSFCSPYSSFFALMGEFHCCASLPVGFFNKILVDHTHFLDNWGLNRWCHWLLLFLYVAASVISIVFDYFIHPLVSFFKQHELGLFRFTGDKEIDFVSSCGLEQLQTVIMCHFLAAFEPLAIALFYLLLIFLNTRLDHL